MKSNNSVIWSKIEKNNLILSVFPKTEYIKHQETSSIVMIVKSFLDKILKK